MKDFTREELEELGERIHGLSGPLYESHGERFTDKAELLALLDMASRAVSVETLALLHSGNVDSPESNYERWKVDLVCAVATDLLPALARSAGEGKDG